MSISSPGIGSGLDVTGIISKLMAIEQQPLNNLDTKEASYQAEISSFGTLQGSVSSLDSAAASLLTSYGQSASQKFSTLSASVADSSIASASASSSAVAGSYSLEVTALAQAQRLTTKAGAFATPSSAIPTGTLNLLVGSGAATPITIDSTNNTLSGLRDAINAANVGVSATIITVSPTDARLVLTSNQAGTASQMTISGLAGFNFDPNNIAGSDLSQDTADGGQAAQGAAFNLNGVAITSDTNTVTNAVSGVTLTLSKVSALNTPTTLTVTQDNSSSLNTTLTALVSAYNDLNKTIGTLGSYNAQTQQGGPLLGNSTLLQTQNLVRGVFGDPVTGLTGTGPFKYMSDIGLEFQKDGSITLNSAKLQTAISSNFGAASDLVAAFGKSLHDKTQAMLDTQNGTVPAAVNGINGSIKDLDAQRATLQLRLTKIEANYKAQFTAMDSMVASWNQTSSFLTQQLSALMGTTSSTSSTTK